MAARRWRPDLEAESDAEPATAESYGGYTSPEARDIIRRALEYADAVERGYVIGGRKTGREEDEGE